MDHEPFRSLDPVTTLATTKCSCAMFDVTGGSEYVAAKYARHISPEPRVGDWVQVNDTDTKGTLAQIDGCRALIGLGLGEFIRRPAADVTVLYHLPDFEG